MIQRIVKKSKKQFRFGINVEKFNDLFFFKNERKELSDISFALAAGLAAAQCTVPMADRPGPPTLFYNERIVMQREMKS